MTLYSRRNCHLCEVAEEVVKLAQSESVFEFEVMFIDGDKELEKMYGLEVPVILINGIRHSCYQVNRDRFLDSLRSLSNSH